MLQIVYDGDCPFCSRYVTLVRLRDAVGNIELIDARTGHDLVTELKDLGYDLNQGMLARYNEVDYFGSDCINLLAMLSSRVGWVNRLNSMLFSNKKVARITYPTLRAGRNLTLLALGRQPIK